MNGKFDCYKGNGGPCQNEFCGNYIQLSKLNNSPFFLRNLPGQEMGCKYPNTQLFEAQQKAKAYVQNEIQEGMLVRV